MGQGVTTSLAQMAAEDLGVGLDAIEMVMGDTDRCPFDMGTFGSLTTRMFGPALRAAAAEARLVLVRLASEQLGVPKDRLVVENGVVSVKGEPAPQGQLRRAREGPGDHADGGREGGAAGRSRSSRSWAARPGGSTPSTRSRAPASTPATSACPGLLHARILRPPAHGATLARVDTSEAAKLDGVTVVNQDGIVAVLHADPEVAEAALARLRPEWNAAPPGADTDGIFDDLLGRAGAPEEKGVRGDVEAARAAAPAGSRAPSTRATSPTRRSSRTRRRPRSRAEKLTVWASTQTPFPTRDGLAQALSLDPKNVRVVTPYVGGGFGGKSSGRQSEEAARLAKITGRPVQVAFTRAEEFFYDAFDPACIVKIVSAMDDGGKITLWDYDVYFAGDRAAQLFYDVPNTRTRVFRGSRDAGAPPHRFGTGPWRAPGANMNVWARESHVDVMAAAAGLDPVEFRLRNMGDERMRRVLQEAAKAFGWTPAPAPSGRGWGVACGVDSGTYATLAVEVKVDRGDRGGEGRARRLRPGHGGRREPRRGDDAGRGLHHDGPRVRAQRGGPDPRRKGPRRQLRHLRDPALLVAPEDRDGPREERRPHAAGRRRARHRPHGGGDRERGASTRRGPGSSGCR